MYSSHRTVATSQLHVLHVHCVRLVYYMHCSTYGNAHARKLCTVTQCIRLEEVLLLVIGLMIFRNRGKRMEFAEFAPRNGKRDLNLKEKTSAILLIKNNFFKFIGPKRIVDD